MINEHIAKKRRRGLSADTQERRKAAVDVIKAAAQKYPTTFVRRTYVPTFTGGVYSTGHMANEDSRGTGPEGAFRIGKNVCYPLESLTDWLLDRLEV